MLFALMVGALRSPASPLREPAIDVLYVDGGRCWISGTTSYGAHHQPFCIDGGRSLISGTASKRAYHLCFLH
jgi:hypothetical protein